MKNANDLRRHFHSAYLKFLITVVHSLNKLTLVRMQLPEKYY
jgi:hypothetical protein